LEAEILETLLPAACARPEASLDDLLAEIGYRQCDRSEILGRTEKLVSEFSLNRRSRHPEALVRWLLGRLRPPALGNVAMKELRREVEKMVLHE
jgi:hypothetical protein